VGDFSKKTGKSDLEMDARFFQGILLQMRDAVHCVVGIMDASGTVIACTELSMIGEVRKEVMQMLIMSNECTKIMGYTYKTVESKAPGFEYAVFVQGEDRVAESVCAVTTVAINNLKLAYDERNDETSFIKNILLDNILPGDIPIRSRELRFSSSSTRAVFLVRCDEADQASVLNVLNSLFSDKQVDFVVIINDTDIAVVKEVKINAELKDLSKIAKMIEEDLAKKLNVKSIIGVGTIAMQLKDIARSFKEAQVAIEVGHVFEPEKTIISYQNLGVGRLIYQLPITLCEMFLSEVFRKGSIDSLDEETLFTVQKFLENNLNVSETSRKLFVHRNTLVYRLEKIKKLTGLDLREFDHAIVFKVALMVKKYLISRENGQI